MIKVFFVDDEALVRKAIVQSVDWEKYDAKVVGEASNGKEALEILETTDVDLVITDIRMPVMDGLELQRQIHELYPKIKVAIVSGYDEFEYAREALRLGACGYLLKPVSEEDLLVLVKEVQVKISIEKKMEKEVSTSYRLVNENIVFIRSQFIFDLLEGRENIDDKTKEKAGNIGIRMRGPKYGVIILKQDEYHPNFADEIGEKLQSFAIQNVVDELFPASIKCAVGYGEPECLIIVYQAKTISYTHLYEIVKKLKTTLADVLQISTSFSLWDKVDHLKMLPSMYQKAKKAMEEQFYGEKGGIYFYKDSVAVSSEDWNARRITFEREFLTAFKKGNACEAEQIMEETINFFRDNKVPAHICQEYAIYIVHELLDYLVEVGGSIGQLNEADYVQKKYVLLIRNLPFLDALYEFLIKTYKLIADRVNSMSELKYSRMVRKAMQYQEQHYFENISLSELAEKVSVTANYFSKVFKKEVGVNYVDWLNRLRIEKAKGLLKEKNCKVYEVASLVGYSEYKYFITMFKKYTKMTPKQYREQIIEKK